MIFNKLSSYFRTYKTLCKAIFLSDTATESINMNSFLKSLPCNDRRAVP